MATQTKRDQAWNASLTMALELDEFDIADVLREAGLDEQSKRTTRDVLSTMAEQGWLQSRVCEHTGRRLYRADESLRSSDSD